MQTKVIGCMASFSFFKHKKSAVKHKNSIKLNNLIEMQAFFEKTVARFSFINIFAFC
ncbi:hypothetical protein Bache_1190 [Bacteroides helcogenes P 36-108]|uniref:Uncharacterized protein n=1 Tax=Bacteroides helcogenes (strain ATCC 35417 / DSM 20613 / JCM 6297 / CCUG 15421 / P 36-108) TaxID=693979 RepID=E6SST7_BACT6|nr:hypothetical protein Bache_1190 [Bacteroides helcogenes P 36-108]